jgi:membrane-associated phospholipid phosphatase
MSADPRKRERTMADAISQRVGARRGASAWAAALRELGAVDRAAYEAVARTPTPTLDAPIRRLSNAANYSKLWLGIAAALSVLGGRRGRTAALESVVSIGVTSATVNILAKSIAARPRPDRAEPDPFPARGVEMPRSTSFPSGHAASGFAFAYAVGRHLPALAVPLRLVAGAVAYSRVHLGVHYPGDVAVGSMVGSGIAAVVASVGDHLEDRHGKIA